MRRGRRQPGHRRAQDRQGRQRAVEPLTPEAIERRRCVLLDAGDPCPATLVSILAYAGLRPGEALGSNGATCGKARCSLSRPSTTAASSARRTNRIYRTADLLKPLAEDRNINASADGTLDVARQSASGPMARRGGPDDWNNWRNRHFTQPPRPRA